MKKGRKEKIYLGFLSVEKSKEKERFIGSILVTNERGVPLEFRCTLPVKPTSIQKPLYGKSLVPYVSLVLCAKPLLNSIEHRLSCLFVNTKHLIGLRDEIEIPLLHVKRSGKELDIEGDKKGGTKKKIESSNDTFDPIIVTTNENFDGDYIKMTEILSDNIKTLDLVEPFSRITTSVEVLTQQDERFN